MKFQSAKLCLLLLFGASPAPGQSLPIDDFATVGIEQRLGATVPLNLRLRDESGRKVSLGSVLGERPAILVFAYHECPNLCSVVLNGLLESVRDLRLEAGRDYSIIVVSIRPQDSPGQAAAKKRAYLGRYGRSGAESAWHFLTGDAPAIAQLTGAAGFHHRFEPATGQFAHASGIMVLTPAGTLSRYFLGIEYPPKELRLALVEAGRGKVGTLADQLLLLCFHFNPQTGRYGLLINRTLQFAGTGTVLALGLLILRLARRPRPHAKPAV